MPARVQYFLAGVIGSVLVLPEVLLDGFFILIPVVIECVLVCPYVLCLCIAACAARGGLAMPAITIAAIASFAFIMRVTPTVE